MTTQNEDKPVSRARIVLSQALACLALDFLLVGLGMSISFVTMVLPDVLDAKEGVSINMKQASWFGSMAFLCQPLGSVFSGPLLDYYGRKKALFLVNIPHLIAWILMYYAWDVPSLFIANALLGIGTGIMEAPSVTYVGEVRLKGLDGSILICGVPTWSSGVAPFTDLKWDNFKAVGAGMRWNLEANDLDLSISNAGVTDLKQMSILSDSSLRGILTTLTNSFTSTGVFLAYLLGTVLPWRKAALVSLSVPAITMVLVLFRAGQRQQLEKLTQRLQRENVEYSEFTHRLGFTLLVPETPIWLLSKGRQKEALHSLCRLRGWVKPEHVKEEFNQLLQYNEVIRQCVVCAKEGKTEMYPCEHTSASVYRRCLQKIKHIFFVKETMRPFTLVMAYFFFHTMSGLAAIRSNMVNVCKALEMKYDPKSIVVLVGVVFIAMNLVSATIVKLYGKRKLVLTALFTTACCSLSLSIYAGVSLPSEVFSYEIHTFTDKKAILPVVLFMLLVSFTSLGIPWVLLSEVFPFRSRGLATGLAAALSYAIMFLASKTNYNLEAAFGLSGTFAIYSAIGFIGTLYLYFFLPETEKKSLVEIEAYYKGNQKIFADDFLINSFRKKRRAGNQANELMLVT